MVKYRQGFISHIKYSHNFVTEFFMTLIDALKQTNFQNKDIAFISTTAKNHGENRLLPSHIIQGKETINIMLHDVTLAESVFHILDKHVNTLFIDVERKQSIDLWDCAVKYVKNATLLPYKPNDLTREATFHLIGQHFNYQLKDKRILIYGCGNLAFKSALYLAELGAKVEITGRNRQKIETIIQTLNAVLPRHSSNHIELSSTGTHANTQYDVLISAVSAEYVIDESYLSVLKDGALVVDIGINNLTPAFIKKAEERFIHIFRVDVRVASPYLEAMLAVHKASFMKKHAGFAVLQGVACVSGGVIGKQGEIIVDSIAHPKRIIGIANGTGGIKKHEEYTKTDVESLEALTLLL
jgi:hypothetical protein